MPGFVPGIDVLVIRQMAVGSIAERHQLTTAYHPLSCRLRPNLQLQLRPAIKTRGVTTCADKITYLSYLRRRISPCCRLGNRGCNRAAAPESTACKVHSPRPHSRRRSTRRRERSGVVSSPSRETPAIRQRSLRTRSRSGSLSCSTSCVCFGLLPRPRITGARPALHKGHHEVVHT